MRGNYWLVEKFKILKCCAPWSLISGWLLDWLIVWLFLQSVSQSERRSRTLFAFSTAVTSSGRKMKVFVMLPSCTNYKRSCKKIIMYSLLSDNRRVFWITSQNQTSRISERNIENHDLEFCGVLRKFCIILLKYHLIALVSNDTLGQLDTTENCVQCTWHRRSQRPRDTAVQRGRWYCGLEFLRDMDLCPCECRVIVR